MKKLLIFCVILLFATGFNTTAIGAPLQGTWNWDTSGLDDGFNGIAAVLDPEQNGANLGDEIRARDRSGDSSPGYGHYWFMGGLTRDTLNLGSFVNNMNGTGTRSFDTTRSGGTFYIRGDNLWGQDSGTLYTASIEGEAHGMSWYDWNPTLNDGNGGWAFNRFEGEVHWWGTFNEDPYLLDFTADGYLDYHGYSSYFDHWITFGDLNNVEIQIDPVPEPTTMLLLGSGLIGLAGLRRRKFKK